MARGFSLILGKRRKFLVINFCISLWLSSLAGVSRVVNAHAHPSATPYRNTVK